MNVCVDVSVDVCGDMCVWGRECVNVYVDVSVGT